MDSVYKNMDYCQSEFSKPTQVECDTSIIVPDSQCDIVKVVCVKASPTVTETKPENNSISVTGQVKFTVLYIGEDDSSRLCSLFAVVPFSHTIPISVSDNCSPIGEVCFHSCEYNLINSRRIKVSSLLKIGVILFKNNRLNILTQAPGAETKTKNIGVLKLSAACSKNISITESADLPAGKESIKSILSYEASVTDYNYKVLNNKIILKGNAFINVMYLSESGISSASASVPFTEVFEAEGVSPEKETDVLLKVYDCDIRSDTDLKGDERMIDINIILSALITAFDREEFDTITDLYAPKKAVECDYKPLKTYKMLKCCSEEEFVKETISLNTVGASIGKIIDVYPHISNISFDKASSLITLSGEVTILYCSSDSSKVNSHTAKITISHKTAFTEPENISATVKHSGFAISGDNTIELRMSVLISAWCKDTEEIKIVTDCNETDYIPQKRASVIVSFVNEPCSMWDIAKKYNVPLKSLASANNLEDNITLSKGTRLIIPR